MSTTTLKILYYLNRSTNLFLYSTEVLENGLKFKINKIQVVFSTILEIVFIYYMTATGFACIFEDKFNFVQTVLNASQFVSLYIIYFNTLLYQKEIKWVSNKIFELDKILKPEMNNPKIVKLFLIEKAVLILCFLIQDVLVYDAIEMELKCYVVGYLQGIPNMLPEISYIFALTKLENQLNACQENLALTHLDCLREIKKCRRVLDSCYQIPMLLKLAMRFSDSLVVFQAIIKQLMRKITLHFEGTISVLTWESEVVIEIIFVLYLIQRNDEKVDFVIMKNNT